MRVCFIGNSHLGPLAKAWTEDPSDLEAVFLAAPGDRLGALTVSNGTLRSSGKLRKTMLETTGVADAAVEEFDAFALVGLRFTVNRCARLFATHRTWRAGEPGVAEDPFLVSHECLLAAAREQLRQSTAMSLAKQLRAVTSAPILLVVQPGLSERVLEVDTEMSKIWRPLHAQGREGEIRTIYDEACTALGEDLEIVAAPKETIAHEILTFREFDRCKPGKGSVTDSKLVHMNLDYGRLAMRELFDRLEPLGYERKGGVGGNAVFGRG
jgi:hypothetical protein